MNVLPILYRKYGDVVRIGPKEVMFATKSAAQKILIKDDFVKSPLYESMRLHPHISSLITERDKTIYKHRRRILSPGFSISYLNGLEPQIVECIEVCKGYIDRECSKGNGYAVIDASNLMGNLAFDIISAAAFGGSFNLVVSNDKKLKNIFMDRLKRSALDSQFPFLKYLPFMPSSQSDEFNGMIDAIISKRRAETGPEKRDLLQIFLDNNDADPDGFTHLHVREEMALFMLAGSDTTGVTLTFTLSLLVSNTDKLQKLIAEIDSTFLAQSDPITFAKTQDLPYLNAVLYESMRVRPLLTIGLARYATETTMISNYEIPGGTIVSPAIGAIQNDSRFWPDAEAFVPERWLGHYKGVEPDKQAYHPFSRGSRRCIGEQFAWRELRVIIATIVRRYELSLIEGQSYEMRMHAVPWFYQGFYNVGFKTRSS